MQKQLDSLVIGLLTLVIVGVILAIRPGYAPAEVSEEAFLLLTPQALVQEAEVDADAEIEVEAETEADAADTEIEAEVETEADETDDESTEEAEDSD